MLRSITRPERCHDLDQCVTAKGVLFERHCVGSVKRADADFGVPTETATTRENLARARTLVPVVIITGTSVISIAGSWPDLWATGYGGDPIGWCFGQIG